MDADERRYKNQVQISASIRVHRRFLLFPVNGHVFFLLAFSVLFFFLEPVESRCTARDYYVSNSGNDSHAGTKEQPWKTIEKTNSVDLRPGEQVLFHGGQTFYGTLRLNAEDRGSEAKKTTISSFGQGLAIIDAGNDEGLLAEQCHHWSIKNLSFRGSGRTRGSNGNGIQLENCQHVEITDVEVSGFRKSGISVNGVHQVKIAHVHAHKNGHAGISSGSSKLSTNLYVGYCTAENNPGDPKNEQNHSGNGIVIGHAKDVLVEYCLAYNNGWDMPRKGNGPVGIWTWNTDKIIIQHCISHDNKSPSADGGGFDLDGGTTNGILQYNLSYNNDGPGYFLCQYPGAPPLKNNIIRYNISQNDGQKANLKTGIEIYSANSKAADCQIYNNTIYNESGAAIGFGGMPIAGVVLKNNLFVTGNEPLVGDSSHARFEGNLWWNKDRHFDYGEFKTFHEWVQATGQERIKEKTVGVFANPKLFRAGQARCEDPSQLNNLRAYRLLSGSPCFKAGIYVLENGGRDFWGDTVSAKVPTSIGACQQVGSKKGAF